MSNTPADKEQRVFSDYSIEIGGSKDFKQEAVKRHQDMVNGVDQKEAEEDFEDFASSVEHGTRLMEHQREKFMHKLYGYEVSETDVRKAATNILRDYDAFAERFGLEGDGKDIVYDQILLLQNGTPEQQEQALKELHERDPELAEAVIKEAHDLKMDGQNLASDPDAQLSAAPAQTAEEQQLSYSTFGLNQDF